MKILSRITVMIASGSLLQQAAYLLAPGVQSDASPNQRYATAPASVERYRTHSGTMLAGMTPLITPA